MSDFEDEREQRQRAILPPIIMNVYDTQYAVVRQVGSEMLRWKLVEDPESMDWDVYWTDSGVAPETLARMKRKFRRNKSAPKNQPLSGHVHLSPQKSSRKTAYQNAQEVPHRVPVLPPHLDAPRGCQ